MERRISGPGKNRTRREFLFDGVPWDVVDAWAEKNRFRLVERKDHRRRYRKGRFYLMAPGLVEICLERNNRVVVEAWVQADPYLILAVLSGKNPEMAVDGGGLTAVVPRRRAREAVNRLLKAFNQPEIT